MLTEETNTDEIVPETAEEVIETIPAAEPLPPVEEEKSYTYQPTDENGRPIGGKQVLKYRTHDELIQKLQEQSVLQIRKLRELTRKSRLGISDVEDIPAEAPRMKEPVAFKARALSAEERVILSRDLLDPDRFEEASDALFEATLGAKPKQIREMLSDIQEKSIRQQAKAESDIFMAANPKYVRCPENSSAITNWMVRYNLEPVRENFQKAYDTLRSAGILVEHQEEGNTPAPAHVEPVALPATPPVVEAAAPARAPVAPGISSGLTRAQAANPGTAPYTGSDIVYEVKLNGQVRRFTGRAAIDAMPSEEYKRRINNDPSFVKKVDKLDQELANRRK